MGEVFNIKKLPKELKQKLIKFQKCTMKASQLEIEIKDIIESYGLEMSLFDGNGDQEVRTEALAFICNAEGEVEENIIEIEEVFLYHVNK